MTRNIIQHMLLIIALIIGTCTGLSAKEFYVDEESLIDTHIGNIGGDITPDSEFLSSKDSYFKISQTGDISVSKKIDLESLCKELTQCCDKSKDCVLEMSAFEKKSTKTYHYNVHVRDVNDFAPKFPHVPVIIDIQENTDTGSVLTFERATDGDFSLGNYQVSYILEQTGNITDYFNLSDQIEPALTIYKQLDYEQVKYLTGVIKACDYNQKCAEAELIVRVIDVNDNKPKFEQSSHDIPIDENYPESSVVTTFTAVDRDSGENALMNFWFDKSSTDSETLDYFEIEKETGKLFLKKPLSIKAKKSFNFKVAVGERKSSNRIPSDITSVRITVRDVNDNPPTIIEYPSSGSIDENRMESFLVAFKVTDNDEGENARTSCELISGNDHLKINKSETYNVKQLREFDAEQEEYIIVDINCTDYGHPPMKTRKTWKIRINDKNEFQPKMLKEKYYLELKENVPHGTFVLKVEAEDKDRDSDLVYALDTVGQQFFHIDSNTGEIRVIGGQPGSMTQLDREQMDKITFRVSATDYQDDMNYQTTAEVTIKLLDENDNEPIIEVLEAFSIYENINGRNRINGKMSAKDPDDGPNGRVRFTMENAWDQNGNTINNQISLDADGNLYSLAKIDREEISEIIVSVIACDEGASLGNGRESRCSQHKNITVQVIDENDNPPEWQYPNPTRIEILNLTTDFTAGSHVTYLKAIDPDYEENGNITYEIVDPLRKTEFIMTPSGQLLINPNATSQNPLLPGRFELLLKATDNGSPKKESRASLIVNVVTSEAMVNAQINFYIIIIMIILTSVISVCLIIAIICVRRKPKGRLLSGLGSSRNQNTSQYSRRCNDTNSGFYASQFCYPIDTSQKASSGLLDVETMDPYGQVIAGNNCYPAGTINSYGRQQKLLLAHNPVMNADLPTPTDDMLSVSGRLNGSVIDGHTGVTSFGQLTSSTLQQRTGTLCLSTGYRQISPGTLLFSNGQMGHSPMGQVQIVDHIDGDSADSGRGASEDDHNNQQNHFLYRSNSPSNNSILNGPISMANGNNKGSIRLIQTNGNNPYFKIGSIGHNSVSRQYLHQGPNQFVSLPENNESEPQNFPIPPIITNTPTDVMQEDRV